MSKTEWITLVQSMKALWPNAKFSPETIRIQFEFVRNVPYEEAFQAMKAMAADDFPPNSARIAQKAAELTALPEPDFDEVRTTFRLMLKDGIFGAGFTPTRDDWRMKGVHDRVAVYFDTVRWRQWCLTPEDDTTFYAQQRDEYRAQMGRWEREARLLAAGVDRKALQRPANGALRKVAVLEPMLELASGGESVRSTS